MSRAARLGAFEGLGALEVVERDVPEPGEGEVRVRVQLAAIHPLEGVIANGGIPFASPPLVLGAVGAGVVETDGETVKAGDRVAIFGNELGMVRDGVWADHVVAPERLVSRLADGTDLAAAAALGIAFPTAVLAVDQVGVPEGGTLLLLGASGAVGTAAAQIAAQRGIRVVGTSRTAEGAAFAARHGVDHPIDLSATTLAEAAAELGTDGFFDGVVDPVGGAVAPAAMKALRPGGAHVILGYSAGLEGTFFLPDVVNWGRRLEGCNMNSRGADGLAAAEAASLAGLEAGDYSVTVAQTFPLEEAAEAARVAAAPETQGRVLLAL